MSELGFMRVAQNVARRRAQRRAAARFFVAFFACTIAVASVALHRYQDGRLSESGLSVNEAVGEDLGRQRERMQGTYRYIRNLLPSSSAAVESHSDPLSPAVDRSGMGPIDDPSWLVVGEI